MKNAWYVSQQWSVITKTAEGWKEIYCTKLKSQATKDAIEWSLKTGQQTEVVRGAGHKDVRALPDGLCAKSWPLPHR